MNIPAVTVVIPSHQARVMSGMTARALWSVSRQTVPSLARVYHDVNATGPAHLRQLGMVEAESRWVAFLDSDDWFYPDHCETLLRGALDTGADVVYSWYTVHDLWEGARPDLDPLAGGFGRAFDPHRPTQTTSTILVNRERLGAAKIGWRRQPDGATIPGTELRSGEDWDLILQCCLAGMKIVHVPRRTWAWHIGYHNTSGIPGRGDSSQQNGE